MPIDPERMVPSKHADLQFAFTELLIDVRLHLSGQGPTNPITDERLTMLTRLLRTLDECKDSRFRKQY